VSSSIHQVGILVDVTRCTGCNQCVDTCAEVNQLGENKYLKQQSPDGLSASRWSAIVESPEGAYVRKFCRHCLDPACVSVCPVGAMYQTDEGVVLYDSDKCMGCRYCMMACPYGIPRYEWDSATPLVQKCIMCYDRLEDGESPACVGACPEKAMAFGEREEMLAMAHKRMQDNPQNYIQKVYGEHEVGGTSVMYISNVSLDFLGFQGAPPEEPMPELTWAWLSKVPGISIAATGLMTGLMWVISRRIQAEEARRSHNTPPEEEQ
jgi:formate dehydrogenase iron-sulfur subunit